MKSALNKGQCEVKIKLVDVQVDFDKKKRNDHSRLSIYVRINDTENGLIELHSEMRDAHYVRFENNSADIATVNFYIPEKVFKGKNRKRTIEVFLHNVKKEALPIKSVKVTLN